MGVPGYTEIRELGHGGTGRVMLAVRDSDGLAVAIKHLSERLRADKEFVTRFRAEARVLREIDSPHIARLLKYTEAGGDAVIVMELVDGVTLRRLLEHEGPTGPEAALVLLKGALLGLAEAHRHEVVHRDFKPENVIVTQDGDSKLVDFGVAAHSGETGALAGTPAYMAPEQWDDAPAGPASDVYAATLVFFECLTGHRAFRSENMAALAYQHQHTPPPLTDVEEALRPLVEHGLAKDPAERPASAEAFLAELEAAALAAYGDEWELRGRTGLGILTVPLAALLPEPQPAAEGGATSLFQNAITPVAKLAVTGGLVLATTAAVASAFVIWHDTPEPESGTALPPASSAPPFTGSPTSPTSVLPTPDASVTGTPSVTHAGQPSALPSTPPTLGQYPTWGGPATAPPRSTRVPAPGQATRAPARSDRPQPSTRPATSAPPDRDQQAADQPAGKPPATKAAATKAPAAEPPATEPPATRAPDPTTPAAKAKEPLLSVSVKVSLGVPLLGGDGDGLLDADIDLGLGSSLLGLVVVPGSMLLGRHLVVRRVRRPRDPATWLDAESPDDPGKPGER
ncbi:protein kinase domain-containing protein [Nonomuraea sp. NPDC002799]